MRANRKAPRDPVADEVQAIVDVIFGPAEFGAGPLSEAERKRWAAAAVEFTRAAATIVAMTIAALTDPSSAPPDVRAVTVA